MRTPHNERVASDTSDLPQAHASGSEDARPERAPRPAKTEPERKCILSGEIVAKDDLIRLAISPDGLVLPDPLARAPGRGAWLGAPRAELEAALAKGKLRGALARAFKGASLSVPDDLSDLIENGLTRVLLDRLGLEMRAGKLILGSDRIGEQARTGRVALLLHASDASEDGSRKLDQAWRVGRDIEGSGERGVRLPLDRMALSVALGRDNVVHLALADAGSAERITSVLTRLLHFLGGKQPEVNNDGQPVAAVHDDDEDLKDS